ncbi:Uncharacterized protein APZ42_007290, partial [Daphnia magna]
QIHNFRNDVWKHVFICSFHSSAWKAIKLHIRHLEVILYTTEFFVIF